MCQALLQAGLLETRELRSSGLFPEPEAPSLGQVAVGSVTFLDDIDLMFKADQSMQLLRKLRKAYAV